MTHIEALDTPEVLVLCPPFRGCLYRRKPAPAMLPALADS
jgi:hypothetical protein